MVKIKFPSHSLWFDLLALVMCDENKCSNNRVEIFFKYWTFSVGEIKIQHIVKNVQ